MKWSRLAKSGFRMGRTLTEQAPTVLCHGVSKNVPIFSMKRLWRSRYKNMLPFVECESRNKHLD